jgi:phage terminase large subunit
VESLDLNARVKLSRFQPRPFQKPLMDALLKDKKKRLLAIWPRRCLAIDTHVLMADGSHKFIQDIEVGDHIMAWDGVKFVTDKVKNVWESGEKEILQISHAGMPALYSSYDHLFAVTINQSNKVFWKPAIGIADQDFVMNYGGSSYGSFVDPLLGEFLGYYLFGGASPENYDIKHKRYESIRMLLYDRDKELPENKLFCGFYISSTLPLVRELDRESLISFFGAVISMRGRILITRSALDKLDVDFRNPTICIELIFYASEYMAWSFYWLLRKLGISPRTPFMRDRCWCIKIGRSEDIKILFSAGNIVGHDDTMAEALNVMKLSKPDRSRKLHNGCFRTRIKKHKIDMRYTYDLETEEYHNFVANGYVVHNSGKDIAAWNMVIMCAIARVGLYLYLLPTATQARKIIWDGIMIDGSPIIDYIPTGVIESKHVQDMKIKLRNGSIIQLAGSDNYDRLMGINAAGIVFSEYALQDPRAYQYLRPVLTAANGWALFISTPRGHNALWTMYQVARDSPDWFCSHLSVHDTQHISLHDIQKEIALGELSEDLAQQEYFTSFDMGIEGSFYAKYLDSLRVKGQIGNDIMWEPSHPVWTSWDIGVRDQTSIVFYQVIGQTVRIIDCYEKNREGLEHYVKIVLGKPYTYAKHFAPHDMKQMEFGSGQTRWAKAHDLGITFHVVDNIPIIDGIEVVRSTLPRCWFNESSSKQLLKALENYRQEYDAKLKVYKGRPLHDQYSHFADAFRYLCVGLRYARKGTSPEQLEKTYHDAVYGGPSLGFFDHNSRY